MTAPLPPPPPSSHSHTSPIPPEAGGRQTPPVWPVSGEAASLVPSSPSPSTSRWRHPVAIPLLTAFTLIPLGLVLLLMVAGRLWAPWQPGAFQGITYAYDKQFQPVEFLLLGAPLEVCGLLLGTTAALLLWSEVPSAPRPRGSVRRPLRTTFTSWARTAGRGKATLLVVLLVALAFGCASFITQFLNLVWSS